MVFSSDFFFAAMAGNIIPAIATTNAITAGIVVLHAFNVLREQYERCQSVYVRLRMNPRGQIFVPDRSRLFHQFHWLNNVNSMNISLSIYSIDATKSKVYRMLGKTTSFRENRHETRYHQAIS